jgi:hypothetical protein
MKAAGSIAERKCSFVRLLFPLIPCLEISLELSCKEAHNSLV